MQRLWSLKTQAGFEPDTSAFIPTRKPDSPWLGVAPQVPSGRQRQELQTKPCRTHFSGLTEKHSFPTSHHESVNSTHRHKGKNTSILLHNKARKKKKRDKTSSVSWFVFQELLCSVMKGAQLYHRSTADPAPQMFVKCRISLTSHQLCITYKWFLLRIYWHRYAWFVISSHSWALIFKLFS